VNTFLPYPPDQDGSSGFWSFRNSAHVLDNKRLNKQTVEALQILDVLCGRVAAWHHHPAVLQWKGHEWALLDYLTDMCLECIDDRHFQNSIYRKTNALREEIPVESSIDMPPWMGDKDFHASHRSRLLFKGRQDVALAALKEYHQFKSFADVKFWLVSDFCSLVISDSFVKTNVFTNKDLEKIEMWLGLKDVNIAPNYYAQFKWAEKDNIPYVWPVTIAKLREKIEV